MVGSAINACLPPIWVRNEVWLGLGGFLGTLARPDLAVLGSGLAVVPRPPPTLNKPWYKGGPREALMVLSLAGGVVVPPLTPPSHTFPFRFVLL